MAVKKQIIKKQYALYNGDCCETLPKLPDNSVHLSIYSPPFCGLYNYSSSERDLSNCRSYKEFFEHYEFVVRELHRSSMPGRCTAVHCMDLPRAGALAGKGLIDFPGDIIRLHERLGFQYAARYHVWKEPLGVRNRTMAKGLSHRQTVEDASLCDVAAADYRGWQGKQTENRRSHWIWRQYASAFWKDVRIDRVLPYKESKAPDDERHVHPLQLDVIERTVIMRTNPGEVVLSPFMGVGSEVYGAVSQGRNGIGIELKESYYKQAVKNVASALSKKGEQQYLLPK